MQHTHTPGARLHNINTQECLLVMPDILINHNDNYDPPVVLMLWAMLDRNAKTYGQVHFVCV